MQVLPINKLKETLAYAWKNPYSDFYPRNWGSFGITELPTIQTQVDWDTLPFTTREMLADVQDPFDRLHVAKQDAAYLLSTSGTSGKGPLLIWQDRKKELTPSVALIRELGSTNLMTFMPYNVVTKFIDETRVAGIKTLAGDAHNLQRSASLARLLEIDTLLVTPTLGILLAEYLEDHLQNIKILGLWGELCSNVSYKQLQKLYPDTQMVFIYASMEAAGIGTSQNLCQDPHHVFHINTNLRYVELVNEEIVVTTLDLPHALPLLRYRTGDRGKLVGGTCPCGNPQPRFEVLGRLEGELVRIAGGEIRLDEINRVMEPFEEFIEPNFKVEVDKLIMGEKEIGTFELYVTVQKKHRQASDLIAEQIRVALTNEFQLSQNMKLKDAVASGLMKIPSVTVTDKIEAHEKHKTLVKKFI